MAHFTPAARLLLISTIHTPEGALWLRCALRIGKETDELGGDAACECRDRQPFRSIYMSILLLTNIFLPRYSLLYICVITIFDMYMADLSSLTPLVAYMEGECQALGPGVTFTRGFVEEGKE
jgi:hypothetical protein